MMPTGCGNLERALRAFLALDVAEVEQRCLRFMNLRRGTRQHLRALEMVSDLDQRACRDDLDIRPRPGRLRPASGGTHQAFVARIHADRRRQYARHPPDPSVE